MRYQMISLQHDIWDCRTFAIDTSHFDRLLQLLFIISVFHEEDYLCGTYRYIVVEDIDEYFGVYKLESCFVKRNYSFICARGMFLCCS
jgi:hypothetical protein